MPARASTPTGGGALSSNGLPASVVAGVGSGTCACASQAVGVLTAVHAVHGARHAGFLNLLGIQGREAGFSTLQMS